MRRQLRTRVAIHLATALVVALPASSAMAARSALQFSPRHYNFGRVQIGTTETATFTLSNTSSEPVSINLTDLAASSFSFEIVASGCSGGIPEDAVLSPEETCFFTIAYTPLTEQGRETATLCVGVEPVRACARMVGRGVT